ncbi:HAD hydrolase-like protein, partial [Pelagibacteraceae bacterium]|nr:HAD hydrolase-like protein [Pelagibacteraceae bacterium]
KTISVFVIGDNLKTDIKGANLFNINSLLILNGIYKDFFRNNEVDFEKLKASVNLELLKINYYQDELTW